MSSCCIWKISLLTVPTFCDWVFPVKIFPQSGWCLNECLVVVVSLALWLGGHAKDGHVVKSRAHAKKSLIYCWHYKIINLEFIVCCIWNIPLSLYNIVVVFSFPSSWYPKHLMVIKTDISWHPKLKLRNNYNAILSDSVMSQLISPFHLNLTAECQLWAGGDLWRGMMIILKFLFL